MKSIKPGRGPSFMGGIGSLVVGVIGVFWTIGAASMGAPPFFALFGVAFVVLAVVQAVYHLRNATGKQRFSTFDITGDNEENDPLNDCFGERAPAREARSEDGEGGFCPYCGAQVGGAFRYCPKCGEELPK